MLRHRYCYLWCVVIVVCLFSARLACVISYSNAISIFLGEYIGEAIRWYNISKLELGASLDEEAGAYIHYGFAIWATLMILTLLIYATVTKRRNVQIRDYK